MNLNWDPDPVERVVQFHLPLQINSKDRRTEVDSKVGESYWKRWQLSKWLNKLLLLTQKDLPIYSKNDARKY